MVRARSGKTVIRRRKRLLKLTKGFRLSRHNLVKQAKITLLRAGVFAFRDRRVRKRMFRERKAITLEGKNVTERDNLYLVVEVLEVDGTLGRRTIVGHRDDDDDDEFVPEMFVFPNNAPGGLTECIASGEE